MKASILRANAVIALALCACTSPPVQQPAAGCFVNAYAGEEYRPPLTTYTGPTHDRLDARTRSLSVGPGARLIAYADSGLAHPVAVLEPGDRVPHLGPPGAPIDFFRLECTGAPTAA